MDDDPTLPDWNHRSRRRLPPTAQVYYASIPVARSPYQYHDDRDYPRDPRTISPPTVPIQYNTIKKAALPYKYHNPNNPNQHPKDVSMPCANVYYAPVLYQPIRYPNDDYLKT